MQELLRIPADDVHIEGLLELPADARGLVLFAHGSDCSRHSPRQTQVARALHAQGSGTLRLDLLTLGETLDPPTRFDVALLTHRLLIATRYVLLHTPPSRALPLAYFGISTGAAAALQAAAALGETVQAVVSCAGRPDLAGAHELAKVRAATLLLVEDVDTRTRPLNHAAYAQLQCEKALDNWAQAAADAGPTQMAQQAATWYARHWH